MVDVSYGFALSQNSLTGTTIGESFVLFKLRTH